MRCARVVVVSVVSGSRAVPSHTYNLSDSIEASAQARSVTPPGGRFCTRSSKGSLAVNTAEKQRTQSISHLRRQVHLKLHMSIYTTITSRGRNSNGFPESRSSNSHRGKFAQIGFFLPKCL